MPLKIEAASWRGRPVSFELFGPWREPARTQRPTAARTRQNWIVGGLLSLLLLVATWLAWRNYRAGRADVGNTMRLAAIGFVAQSLGGIVAIHHVPTPIELSHVADAFGGGLFVAALAGVLYLALEPFVRRRWPQTLISWTRLFAGDVRDPLVAGHILLGVTLAVAVAITLNGVDWYGWQARAVLQLNTNRIDTLDSSLLASLVLRGVIVPAAIVMGFLFLVVLFRLLLRNTWVAVAAVLAVGTATNVAGSAAPLTLVSETPRGCEGCQGCDRC